MPNSAPAPFTPRRGPWWSSFGYAWNGLIHTVVHQPHMRIHLIAGILVGLVGISVPLGLAEKVTFVFCVLLIFFAEILNSALEQLVDLAVQQFDEKARVTKDAAAAGVLVLAIGTVVIFAAVMVHNWDAVVSHQRQIMRQIAWGIPFTLSSALLLWPGRKPWQADVVLFLAGCLLLGILSLESQSIVFSMMTLGLHIVAGDAARARRRGLHALPPRSPKRTEG